MKDYLARSRSARYGILFALPLLVLYEAASLLLNGSPIAGVRNGADVMLKSLFVGLGGRGGVLVFCGARLRAGAGVGWGGPPRPCGGPRGRARRPLWTAGARQGA